MSLVMAACGVCGGSKFARVYAGTISDPDVDPSAYYSTSRRKAGYLAIVRCTACGLLMTNPRDDEATLRRVYAELADQAYEAEVAGRMATAADHLALVSRYALRPGRLLDVGCATGFFPALAADSGWETVGLEPSAWAIERARRRAPRTRFVEGALESADFAPGQFDVITMWDVMEHVESPVMALDRVRGWLAPGGLLFANVPNAESWPARIMGRRWVLLLREHLWYFSPATMGDLLKREGFRLERTHANLVRFSVSGILSRLGQYPGLAGRLSRRLAERRFGRRITIRFSIGDMSVVAVRT